MDKGHTRKLIEVATRETVELTPFMGLDQWGSCKMDPCNVNGSWTLGSCLGVTNCARVIRSNF